MWNNGGQQSLGDLRQSNNPLQTFLPQTGYDPGYRQDKSIVAGGIPSGPTPSNFGDSMRRWGASHNFQQPGPVNIRNSNPWMDRMSKEQYLNRAPIQKYPQPNPYYTPGDNRSFADGPIALTRNAEGRATGYEQAPMDRDRYLQRSEVDPRRMNRRRRMMLRRRKLMERQRMSELANLGRGRQWS